MNKENVTASPSLVEYGDEYKGKKGDEGSGHIRLLEGQAGLGARKENHDSC